MGHSGYNKFRRMLALAVVAAMTCGLIHAEGPSGRVGKEKVGLVLSGGGAKGIAHVGVIKALEDNDIPIDYVTGTSMGAIVGSFYSCGWSPEKMYSLFTSREFLNWSQGIVAPENKYEYYRPDPTPKWIGVNVNFKGGEALPFQIIPTSIISPIPMNIEFLELYARYTDQCGGNFNNLFVPFRCVASNIYAKHKVVFSKGSLGDAVRASMSFPLVFRPIKVGDVLLYDGGIYDNFPVNVMEEQFHPDFVIGVSVSRADEKPIQGDVYNQLEDMIIQNNDYSLPAKEGVKIQVPVTQFGVLSFDKAKTIYDIGYQTGLSMVDSIKKRISARVPLEDVTRRREEFAARTPEVTFDSVEVTGVKHDQEARYLEYLFGGEENKPITLEEVGKSYYRAVGDGTLSNLVPQARFNPDGKNTLLLEATLKRPWSLGVGGWITSSANSQLFLTASYHTLRYNSLDLSLSGWIGQSYLAGMFTTKFSLRTDIPSFLQLDCVVSRQRFYDADVLFFQADSPTFITEFESFARLSYVWAMGRKMKGYARMVGGYMWDTYFPTSNEDYATTPKDRTQYGIGAVRVGVVSNSLNNNLYPSAGQELRAELLYALESERYLPKGVDTGEKFNPKSRASVEFYWKEFFRTGRKFTIGAMATAYGTLERLTQNYVATTIHAPVFAPTPATKNYFNAGYRSNNYVAAGFIPMWHPASNLQVRGDFYLYEPLRKINDNGAAVATYGHWFCRPEFIGEVSVVYNFPFASLSVYGNYLTAPSGNWNFGLNFGLLFGAPKMLR